MIITKLTGGLGNQMFQYAVGRRMAYRNNTELKLDITEYDNQVGITKREYMLHIFKIKENFANKNGIKRLNFKEKHFHFDPNILKIKDNTCFEGYWQSEKYFKDVEDIIRKEFTFKDNPSERNKKIIKQMQQCNSVSIHVRRGDYANDKKTNQFHGICNLEYYDKAISLISKKIRNPYFFVFSDDIDWVKINLKIKYPIDFIDWNTGNNNFEDMRLMSACKHNIIANSTFSWWSAWLNKNKEKLIVTPRKWFRNPEINTKDLIPKQWLKI